MFPPKFLPQLTIDDDTEKSKITTPITTASAVAVASDEFMYKIEISRQSPLIRLAPFLYEQQLLRVGGRLEASALSYDAKHQILLPYNDPLVKLIFSMFHQENKHCGSQTLLNTIRQRFWPIKGKITARSTIQKCVRCVRAQPQLCQQIMGNLPHTRVTSARPFINAGVDYCGPFWIHYKVRTGI